uniref:Mot1 central domain-containing protein n=1 Tax=Clytia hemisphaerica TaxID=252671 RepID=A0A7M5XDP0_9CNID
MATRLDRLLVILDTGSTPVTRKAAAKQLGEIQKLHPHELPNLLGRVFVYLRSKNWDTRVAAAHAIQAIAENVPEWNPDGLKIKPEEYCALENVNLDGKLRFEDFDINTVLERGEKLLGSAGEEYDFEDTILSGMSRSETIAHQRQQLKKKLGFGGNMDLGFDSMLDDEDLVTTNNVGDGGGSKKVMSQLSTESAADIVASQIAAISSDGQMSSREKNRAKRKAKSLAKQRSKENENRSFDTGEGPAEKKQRRTQSVLVEQPSEDGKIMIDNVSDGTMSMDELDEWPFEAFCVELCGELFNPSWEIRHGASSALREIVKLHGNSAGKTRDTPSMKMIDVNTEWLEDVALKLLCVFALDRFGDYVSDEVVAPVHETCAQTLGTVLHHMPKGSVIKVLSVLIKLQTQEKHWQVRHGGLLGLKYMLAVRKDMAIELLPDTIPWILKGFQDGDDDVRAVAAAALLPVAEDLGSHFQDEIPNMLTILWDILLELDDLTASTNSVMMLLSSLITITTNSNDLPAMTELNELVPRLWPFFRHNISSVRLSSLKTLDILIDSSKNTSWLSTILAEQMRHLYQRIILEESNEIRSMACEVWLKVLKAVPIHFLQQTVNWHAPTWFRLLIHPPNIPIDYSLLTYQNNSGGGQKSKGKNETTAEQYYVANINVAMDQTTQDSLIFTARITAARAIGNLFAIFTQDATKQTLMFLLTAIETFIASSSGSKILVSALVLHEWARACPNLQCPPTVVETLHRVLSNQIVYDELLYLHQRLQIDSQALVNAFAENGLDILRGATVDSYTLDMSNVIAGSLYNESCKSLPASALPMIQSRQRQLTTTIETFQNDYQKLHIRVLSSVAGSLIALNRLTEKLNPIIHPIMDSVKKEENTKLQKRTAIALAQLLTLCKNRTPCPNAKIVKNLCTFVCSDPNHTPPLILDDMKRLDVDSALPLSSTDAGPSTLEEIPKCGTTLGILTLQRKQKEALRNTASRRGKLTRNNSSNTTSRSGSNQSAKEMGVTAALLKEIESDEANASLVVQRLGGTTALSTCAERMGEELPIILPALWDTCCNYVINTVKMSTDQVHNEAELKQIINSLQVLEATVLALHQSLKKQTKSLLPHLLNCFNYPYTSIRHMASRCFGVLSKVITTETMEIVLTKVVDVLKQSENVMCRQGAIEAIIHIIENLGMDILPYIVLLIVPVLGRMSDHSEEIRLMATNCFATLVQLMPLEASIPDPPNMSDFLIKKKEDERHFLDQLLDGSKLDKFSIPVPIKCELRKYQQIILH